MIVFGWNTFLLIKMLAHEVGFAEPNEQVDYHIEIRQKYFHLFWIPFCPISKMYAIRKHLDNELYEINPEAAAFLQKNITPPRTPWYSFSGLIILSVILLYGIISA